MHELIPSPTTTELVLLALLATGVLVAVVGWWLPRSRVLAATLAALVGTTGAIGTLRPGALQGQEAVELAGVLLAGCLAVLGGGPLTTAVFGMVDRGPGEAQGSMRRAAEVLRGGAWIGALERAAVFASLAAGWPEGIAISLAVKGLGRYPELRHEERPGIAERFLIGTFTSVLWAAACAGTVRLLL